MSNWHNESGEWLNKTFKKLVALHFTFLSQNLLSHGTMIIKFLLGQKIL